MSDEANKTKGWNPFGWAATMAMNGVDLSDEDTAIVDAFLQRIGKLTQDQRLTIFDMFSDFFCPRCGIEQPPGDCQCGTSE